MKLRLPKHETRHVPRAALTLSGEREPLINGHLDTKRLVAAAALFALLLLGACNTVEGFAKDLKSLGNNIEEEIEEEEIEDEAEEDECE